jgi:riboflavin kinase/FMN adenylyltransferase
MQVLIGVVETGKRHGTELGYPTANIPLDNAAFSGIYVGRVLVDDTTYGAALYADPSRGVLEAHLLEFAGDLYGKTITIEIGEKIRDIQQFKDNAEARATIAGDIAQIQEYLKNHHQ